MRSSYDASCQASGRADLLRSFCGMIAFYGPLALVVFVLGLLTYYAPIAGTGLTVAPERNDRTVAIVDHRPNLDRPMTDRRVSAVDSSRSTGRGTP